VTTTSLEIRVRGRVQGVGYRYFAIGTAEQMGVTGYAKNLADGRVEVYAIGTIAQLRDFARELQRGPAFASVADVAEVGPAALGVRPSTLWRVCAQS